MAVLVSAPFLQILDINGDPVPGAKLRTYAAGTLTPKATYTDSTASIQATNPVIFDSSGKASVWIQGAYKFFLTDANDIPIGPNGGYTDDIVSYSSASSSATSYFQSFSGNGSQTAFTLSQDFGTDENAIMVFVNNTPSLTNTPFFQALNSTNPQSVFTVSQDLGTDPKALEVFVNTASLGFQILPATSYTINGTTLTLTTPINTFSPGVLVFKNPVLNSTSTGLGFQILPPTAYTVNGTSLSLAVAPLTGTNNILVFSPSSAVGAANASAAAADASATAAGNAAVAAAISASSAAGYAAAKNQWTFSSTITMADPGTGFLRFNNSTLSLATAMAISNLSANSGNPDLSTWLATWDDTTSSPRGEIQIFKNNGNFVIFNITGANVDNTGWKQITLTNVASAGSFSNNDQIFLGFTAYGTTTVVGGITASSVDTLTNKTYDTAGTGNIFKINGTQITTKTGTGAAVLANSPTLVTPVLGVAAATSINFGQDALDYYRAASTFIPTIQGAMTPGSPTYVVQSGFYIRMGDMVYATLTLQISAIGGMTGRLKLGGLPFACNSSVASSGLSVSRYENAAASSYTFYPLITGGTTLIDLYKAASSSVADFTQADITANFQIRMSGCYLI